MVNKGRYTSKRSPTSTHVSFDASQQQQPTSASSAQCWQLLPDVVGVLFHYCRVARARIADRHAVEDVLRAGDHLASILTEFTVATRTTDRVDHQRLDAVALATLAWIIAINYLFNDVTETKG